MKNFSSVLVRLGYFYLCFPVLIFIVGWCNLPTALIAGLLVCVSFYLACKNAPKLWVPQNAFQKRLLFFVALISLLWVYWAGIGGFVFQNLDHNCRNPLFEILIHLKWPVTLPQLPAVLTYYIGFWMPSALIGKLFHSVLVGYCCQVIWGTLGVFLFFYLTLACVKKKNFTPVFIFILFSGLDALGCVLLGNVSALQHFTSHLEWWHASFQFSSFTTQLFWVFNQAVPAWVAVMLMYHEKNNKNLLFLYACTFLHSTLPAFGLFPFVVYWYLKNGTSYLFFKNALAHFKEVFISSLSLQNIAGGLAVSIVIFSYLAGNAAGADRGIVPISSLLVLLFWLEEFFLVEAGLYLLCLYKQQRYNILFYLTTGCLLIYPFIKVGHGPDFCMRATIPALIILYIMVVKNLQRPVFKKKQPVAFYALILLLCIGSITPLHEFYRTFYWTNRGVTKVAPQLSFDNFFGWTDGNLFMKYFGKQIKN